MTRSVRVKQYVPRGTEAEEAAAAATRFAVVCHVGSVEVFEEILTDYPEFFKKKRADLFMSFSTEDIRASVEPMVPDVVRSVVTDNRGCDVGGFLLLLSEMPIDRYDIVIKIHTKTNRVWRMGMIGSLHAMLSAGTAGEHKPIPLLYADRRYILPNHKLVNREQIKGIISRNFPDSLTRLDDLIDHYHPREHFADTVAYSGLDPNPHFYKAYEVDSPSLRHWHEHGIHEFHRISNYHYVRRFSRRNNNFVAGTCFAMNRAYASMLQRVDARAEFERLEKGYIRNDVERATHAWEYFFGLLCYLYGGEILATDMMQPVPMGHSRRLLESRSRINRPVTEARVAFLLLPAGGAPLSGGYRTLLRYIHALNEMGQTVDIYLGTAWNNHDVAANVTDTSHWGEPACSNWFRGGIDHHIDSIRSYEAFESQRNNFYVGQRLQRRYDVVVANAWQVADAALKNADKVTHMAYIIQDREELFYPCKPAFQDKVRRTYSPKFHYFCLSRYLTKYFSDTLKQSSVVGCTLGFDRSLYWRLNDGHERRQNEVVVAYYKHKQQRMPKLMERVIHRLVNNDIVVHVFPDHFWDESSGRVRNHGPMDEQTLNGLYNRVKCGIVFSNTNPSRLGFEMVGAGLQVIEYKSEFTEFDLPSSLVHRMGIKDDPLPLVRRMFAKKDWDDDLKTFEEEHDIQRELESVQTFFSGLLVQSE